MWPHQRPRTPRMIWIKGKLLMKLPKRLSGVVSVRLVRVEKQFLGRGIRMQILSLLVRRLVDKKQRLVGRLLVGRASSLEDLYARVDLGRKTFSSQAP